MSVCNVKSKKSASYMAKEREISGDLYTLSSNATEMSYLIGLGTRTQVAGEQQLSLYDEDLLPTNLLFAKVTSWVIAGRTVFAKSPMTKFSKGHPCDCLPS